MRKYSIFTAVLLLCTVLLWSTAFAIPSLPEFYKLKFENFEWIAPIIPPGQDMADGVEDNWGIFKVTSIIDRLAVATTWSDGDDGYQITGIFCKLDVDDVDPKGAGFTVNHTNRIIQPSIDFYIQNVADAGYTNFDPTLGPGGRIGGPGSQLYTTVTDGTLLVSADFMPGILPVAFPPLPTYGLDILPFDPIDTVINTDVDGLTAPFTGDGAGYLDVNLVKGGPWANAMNTDTFKPVIDTNNDRVPDTILSRDMFLEFDIRPHPDPLLPDWGWMANSEDPLIGVVPEPCTLLLLGSGLLGIGGYARRKTKKR